jgi:hypothetical protein
MFMRCAIPLSISSQLADDELPGKSLNAWFNANSAVDGISIRQPCFFRSAGGRQRSLLQQSIQTHYRLILDLLQGTGDEFKVLIAEFTGLMPVETGEQRARGWAHGDAVGLCPHCSAALS